MVIMQKKENFSLSENMINGHDIFYHLVACQINVLRRKEKKIIKNIGFQTTLDPIDFHGMDKNIYF